MYDSVFYALHSRRNEFFPTGKNFEFKTLQSPTIVRLLSAAVSQVKNYGKNYFTLRLRRRPYYFLTAIDFKRRGNQDFARREVRLSKDSTPQASSSQCIQGVDSGDATLSTSIADYEFHPHVRRTE